MKPIYFPLTSISEATIAASASCFEQIAVYQPCSRNIPETVQKWAEKGLLDIRVPIKEDDERLERLIKEYKAWADLRQGNESAFFKSLKNTVPFFNETYPSQIRSELKKRIGEASEEKEKTEPLFKARVFLCMAQEADIRNIELNRDIKEFKAKEQEMFKSLKGEDDFDISESEFISPEAEISMPEDDPGIYMTAERTEAWFHLMQHDHDSEPSRIFVTDSRAVFEYMTERIPDAETVLCLKEIPFCKDPSDEKFRSWQNNLKKYLDRLAENGSTDTAVIPPIRENRNFSLTFCVIPDKSPIQIFGQCLCFPDIRNEKEGGKYKNTVIGLIERDVR